MVNYSIEPTIRSRKRVQKLTLWTALIALISVSFCYLAAAADNREIGSVTVLADSRLTVPISELATLFTHEDFVTITSIFGESIAQKKKIEDGEAADLFITADGSLIQQLKLKGMVDVYSIGRIASEKDTRFTAAVVASENMTAAREFLKFLKSPRAQEVFKKNGLTAP